MSDSVVKMILLAVIQGITEFLPISSSGHLAIAQRFMEIREDNLLITIVLHAGTLLAILCYYAKDILQEIKDKNYRLLGLICIGTVPLVFIAFTPIKDLLEANATNLWLCAFGFVVSFVLLVFVLKNKDNNKGIKEMTILDALLIGLIQALAILPGVSRSGSTIALSTRRNYNAKNAAKFSFFLGIPAIAGAVVLDMKDLLGKFSENSQGIGILELSIGFFVAFVVGYLSLAVLIKLLQKGRLAWFGYYTMAVAGAIVLYQFGKGG